MSPWFADTFFYLALLNPDDESHADAVAARDLAHLTITTEFVMIELADHLSDHRNRHLFLALYDLLLRNRSVEIVSATDDLLAAGRDIYAARPDKDWSLTDCISFVVMTERGITEALTGDHHFEQAGFTALLK
jgi:uncharacterized protein